MQRTKKSQDNLQTEEQRIEEPSEMTHLIRY